MKVTHKNAGAFSAGENIDIQFTRPVNGRVNCAFATITRKEALNLIGRLVEALEQHAADQTKAGKPWAG